MGGVDSRTRRQRGEIEKLPSGSYRVKVYAGIDPVSSRRRYLTEIVPAGPRARREAEKARTRLVSQVDERRNPRTKATIAQLMDRHLGMLRLEPSTLSGYEGYVARHIKPLIGDVTVGALDGDILDSFYAELYRCQEHCNGKQRKDHRTQAPHECDDRCVPHACRPLADSTARQIHYLLSSAFKRALRWRWVTVNPIDQAEPPRAPTPEPQPPTVTEAAKIINEAMRDPDWGALVWVATTTGARRGELCGLRWDCVDLDRGALTIRRSVAKDRKVGWYVKDTKTHQQRRVALDPATVAVIAEHRERAEARASAVGAEVGPDSFVFSLEPDQSSFRTPGAVTQRYTKLAARLGIDTHLHALRHYSATELIAAGVDIRTVAGRLGHGGGGTTTLRFYSAWRQEADQRAAANLGVPMPDRQEPGALDLPDIDPESPYQRVAIALRDKILSGAFGQGLPLPSVQHLAADHGVGASTARRAINLLGEWGLVDVRPGQPKIVRRLPGRDVSASVDQGLDPQPVSPAETKGTHQWLNLEVRRLGQTVARLDAQADSTNGAELRRLLADAVKRDGQPASAIGEYEMVVRSSGGQEPLRTFVSAA